MCHVAPNVGQGRRSNRTPLFRGRSAIGRCARKEENGQIRPRDVNNRTLPLLY